MSSNRALTAISTFSVLLCPYTTLLVRAKLFIPRPNGEGTVYLINSVPFGLVPRKSLQSTVLYLIHQYPNLCPFLNLFRVSYWPYPSIQKGGKKNQSSLKVRFQRQGTSLSDKCSFSKIPRTHFVKNHKSKADIYAPDEPTNPCISTCKWHSIACK